MNLFVAVGLLLVVFIVLLILGYIWYQKQKENRDECNIEETLSVTFFSMKMQRLQQRLKIIKHQIRCLEEE